jgi:hypothetical protein
MKRVIAVLLSIISISIFADYESDKGEVIYYLDNVKKEYNILINDKENKYAINKYVNESKHYFKEIVMHHESDLQMFLAKNLLAYGDIFYAKSLGVDDEYFQDFYKSKGDVLFDFFSKMIVDFEKNGDKNIDFWSVATNNLLYENFDDVLLFVWEIGDKND